jgi:hypothetical protein
MSIIFEELPNIILEKLFNLLNDIYEKEKQFIKEKFKFLDNQKHNNS